MVKRPLTRIDYPPGPSARFGPLLAMERATYLQCFTISARLGYIGATAQHHSPLNGGGKGAAARDNRRVLFPRRRRDGEPLARHLLVRSPPGLGKTKEAMEWATRYQTEQEGKGSILQVFRIDITAAGAKAQVAIFVPRHELAREVKEVIEENRRNRGQPVEGPGLRGRDHAAETGRAPCRRWPEARELGGKGLPVYSNLCRRRHDRETFECPHFADCEYIRDWHDAYKAPYVILVHSHLGVGWESTGIVRGSFGFEGDGENAGPRFERSFNPADAAIVVA